MSLSDKIKNAKKGESLFDDIPAEKMHALEMRAKIALAICHERKRRGLNQAEFAQFCGVSQPMVSKWESGEYNFTVEAWSQLSYKLSIPFSPAVPCLCARSDDAEYHAIASASASYTSLPNVVDFSHYREAHLNDLKEQ